MRPPVVPDPVFLLDYDGTLAEIAPRPELARPYPGVPGLLVALARRHPVYLVTGRRLADLERLLGPTGRRLADLERLLGPLGLPAFGVHGAEEGVLGGAVKSRGRGEEPGSRGGGPGCSGPPFASAPGPRAPRRGQGARPRPPLPGGAGRGGGDGGDRAPAGPAVAREVAARHPGRTPVAIGDDATDEAMFQALPHGVTIKVGPGPTAARYRLEGVPEVVRYLKQYLEGDEDQHA